MLIQFGDQISVKSCVVSSEKRSALQSGRLRVGKMETNNEFGKLKILRGVLKVDNEFLTAEIGEIVTPRMVVLTDKSDWIIA